jgi:hypothetical protein
MLPYNSLNSNQNVARELFLVFEIISLMSVMFFCPKIDFNHQYMVNNDFER